MVVTTTLDVRVPQPGREADYGVPAVLWPVLAAAYRQRNTCADDDVTIIDEAILRLVQPWIRR